MGAKTAKVLGYLERKRKRILDENSSMHCYLLGRCGLSLTGFATTTFASGSDPLPLVSDCLGNGDQRMVLNRDTFCDCTAPILLGVSLIMCLCVDS